MDAHWKFKVKHWQYTKKYPSRFFTHEHPLQAVSVQERVIQKRFQSFVANQSASPSTNLLFTDPLSGVLDGTDPLNISDNLANNKKQQSIDLKQGKCVDHSPNQESKLLTWDEFQINILSKFHTKQQLTLASSFLSSTETAVSSRNIPDYRRVVKVQSNIPDRKTGSNQTGVERVKARLEQLDSLDDIIGSSSSGGLREMGGLTQQQFTLHLKALKEEMKDAWNTDQRVKALKIAIQCVKALALSSPELFYPCKFMIIADILDTLGILVQKRLMQLLNSSSFSGKNLSKLEAAETAHNWLYKIASIRELLPRIFLEAALIQCYSILDPWESEGVHKKLLQMCRGISDPIVGAYARMYIIKSSFNKEFQEVHHIILAIEDILNCARWGWSGQGIEGIDVMKEDVESGRIIAERVLTPPLTWLLQCFCRCATSQQLTELLNLCINMTGVICYVFLMSILKTFPPPFLSANACLICQYIQKCYNFGEYPQKIIIELAVIVNKVPPQDSKIKLLNGAWHLVTQIQAVNYYLQAASAWIQFAATWFTWRDLDKIIADILKRLSKFTTTDPHDFYPLLLQLITTALCYCMHTEELCNLSSFQGLLCIFHREAMNSGSVARGGVGVGEMKKLLDTALTHHSKEFTDPTVIRLFLSLFSSLHDGINALTTEDEKRQIAQLVNAFVRQVNFGRDYEQQLEFFVDARASFSSLDIVLESLVQQVCKLQVATLLAVKGRHTAKTASFERACTAYCFITIPSLTSAINRLKLYLLAGTVAMINNCMGQGDACVKSAIKEVLDISTELPSNSDPKSGYSPYTLEEIMMVISDVSSYLIAIPDPPDCSQPLYLFRGLSNAIQSFNFLDPIEYCKLNLAVLKGVCCSTRNVFPYHLTDVDGNDTLYGGDLALMTEAEDISTALLAQILLYLKKPTSSLEFTQKYFLCDLLDTVLTYCDVHDSKIYALASGLILLSNRFKGGLKLEYETKLNALR